MQDLLGLVLATSTYTPYYCEENVYNLLDTLGKLGNCDADDNEDHDQSARSGQDSSLRASSLVKTRNRVHQTYAAFVSNPTRTSLLFDQKAPGGGSAAGLQNATSREDQGNHVIWDYHVFAIIVLSPPELMELGKRAEDVGERQLEEAAEVVVIDRDSELGPIVPLKDYITRTFRSSLYELPLVHPTYQSRIRLVTGSHLLRHFSSDRSHMLFQTNDMITETAVVGSGNESRSYIHPPPPYPPIVGDSALSIGHLNNLWTRWLDMTVEETPAQMDPGRREDRKGPIDLGHADPSRLGLSQGNKDLLHRLAQVDSNDFGSVFRTPQELLSLEWGQ